MKRRGCQIENAPPNTKSKPIGKLSSSHDEDDEKKRLIIRETTHQKDKKHPISFSFFISFSRTTFVLDVINESSGVMLQKWQWFLQCRKKHLRKVSARMAVLRKRILSTKMLTLRDKQRRFLKENVLKRHWKICDPPLSLGVRTYPND